MSKIENPSCSECGQLHCYRREKRFPDFCLTKAIDQVEVDKSIALYQGESTDARLARAAAEVEGLYYGKKTRIEEIIAFARRIGAHKIGIASCLGLIEETRLFAKVLRLAKLEPCTVLCKVGSVDKEEIGIGRELKIKCDSFEACCNPVLQARLLNEQETGLNVVIGLCVGHDALFGKHSEAPVTTLITKDRVTGHNPAAALYTANFYYKHILDPEYLQSL